MRANAPVLRLLPEDEYMHPLEAAKNFNESMYFNAFDPALRLGGWYRLGNRANEGHAELSVCIYDADGTVYFEHRRPAIRDNAAFDAGGMRFDVEEPFRALRVRYRGEATALAQPMEMLDPKRAFTSNPRLAIEVDLRFEGLSPMFGGEPVGADGTPWMENASDETGFARGHYEQHVRSVGTLRLGDRTLRVDGHGLRDHSWGPRYWQSPLYYRWLTINFGPERGAMLTVLVGRDGSVKRHGTLFHHGRYDAIVDCHVEVDYDADAMHRSFHARATTESGERFDFEGEVISTIPLRNRRTTPSGETLHTRIAEAFTRYRCPQWEGIEGFGMSEFLDQLDAGLPAGNRDDARS